MVDAVMRNTLGGHTFTDTHCLRQARSTAGRRSSGPHRRGRVGRATPAQQREAGVPDQRGRNLGSGRTGRRRGRARCRTSARSRGLPVLAPGTLAVARCAHRARQKRRPQLWRLAFAAAARALGHVCRHKRRSRQHLFPSQGAPHLQVVLDQPRLHQVDGKPAVPRDRGSGALTWRRANLRQGHETAARRAHQYSVSSPSNMTCTRSFLVFGRPARAQALTCRPAQSRCWLSATVRFQRRQASGPVYLLPARGTSAKGPHGRCFHRPQRFGPLAHRRGVRRPVTCGARVDPSLSIALFCLPFPACTHNGAVPCI